MISSSLLLLTEPERINYVFRQHSVILKCAFHNADKIEWTCFGGKLSPQFVKFTKKKDVAVSEAEIKFSKVKNFLGDSECFCVGSDSTQEIKSKKVQVREAYMTKKFQLHPDSQTVVKGSSFTLQCKSPRSEPPAKILWMRNGNLLSLWNRDYEILNNQELKIENADIENTGRYSCVANNTFFQRESDVAVINLVWYSDWSSWSTCISCEKSRTRKCETKTGETAIDFCLTAGPTEEFASCPCENEKAKLSQAWSPWSSCDSNCQQSRTKICSSHSRCSEPNLEIRQCCSVEMTQITQVQVLNVESKANYFWLILVSVITGTIVVITSLVTFFVLRRNCCKKETNVTSSFYVEDKLPQRISSPGYHHSRFYSASSSSFHYSSNPPPIYPDSPVSYRDASDELTPLYKRGHVENRLSSVVETEKTKRAELTNYFALKK